MASSAQVDGSGTLALPTAEFGTPLGSGSVWFTVCGASSPVLRPLLIEGEAGVGKTAVARALATALGADLIRLQCYEGLDANAAVYEWNYQRQLLAIKIREGEALSADEKEEHIFQDKFLLKRPLLDAISRESPPVLLIDEIDRADEEFEAYLLEILAEFQVSSYLVYGD